MIRQASRRVNVGRRGISLLEVLIAMFVLLFGLMGLLAMIPIANFHLLKAAQYDRAAALAEVAFGDIRARRLLRPENWQTGAGAPVIFDNRFYVQPDPLDNRKWVPGTFCVDPLWMAPANASFNIDNLTPVGTPPYFPAVSASTTKDIALFNARFAPNALPRVSWPGTNSPPRMERSLADKFFVWDGDLALELPDDHDTPSRLLTSRSPTAAPLKRESKGDYSWMFTATPTGNGPIWAPDGLGAGSGRWVGDVQYEVSVVVFYKRVLAREYAEERMFPVVEFYGGLSGGEARLISTGKTDFKDIREGQWLLLTAREPSGRLVAKWYRIITAGEGMNDIDTGRPTWWVGLSGPDWNANLGGVQAIIAPDVVGVFTQTMSITQD